MRRGLPAAVRFARFSADGRRLVIVRADQVARVFDALELRTVGGELR